MAYSCDHNRHPVPEDGQVIVGVAKMCDCLDEENEEGKPLTWTYVGQGRGDWAEAKNLEFVGHGKGAFIRDAEHKPSIFCRSNVLICMGCVSLFFLVPFLIWLIFFSGKFQMPIGHSEVVQPQVWSCASPPLVGAAAAGAAIMEEAWMALDVDMDGYIPKASLSLWQSENLMSTSAAKYLNSTKAADGMISNDGYIQTLLEADTGALGDEKWVSGAWLLCDKNQDGPARQQLSCGSAECTNTVRTSAREMGQQPCTCCLKREQEYQELPRYHSIGRGTLQTLQGSRVSYAAGSTSSRATAAAPPPEESNGLGLSTGSCILCHEVAANTMCLPCGHLLICFRCSLRYALPDGSGLYADIRCPTCKKSVQSFQRVFFQTAATMTRLARPSSSRWADWSVA
eukprot:s1097_g15.t1